MNKIISMEEMIPLIKEQIENKGEVRFTPKGNSMLPMLRNNQDVVVLKGMDEAPQIYDLVLYVRDNGTYVLHRIVGKSRDGSYIMRGDHQFGDEHGIFPEQFIGIVTAFQRKQKTYHCNDKKYQLYCRLWVHTVKIRWWIKKMKNVAGKVKRKLTIHG